MPRRTPLSRLFRRAGFDEPPEPALVELLQRLHELSADDADAALMEVMRLHRELSASRTECVRAAEAAVRLESLLSELLDGDAILGRLEQLITTSPRPVALVRLGGQTHRLDIHPSVDVHDLRTVFPWDYVLVHAKEMVVTGAVRDDAFFRRAHGEVAEFKGYHDHDAGLARVERHGQDESIVQLVGDLLDTELAPSARLVLQRDDPRFAIARLAADEGRSPFEYPIEDIETRFSDLVGLDDIIEPLLEDVLLRLVRPEVREQFDLLPLRGLLLLSLKPGQGKTALVRALAGWLHDLGKQLDFDVVLHVVKPGELRVVWHGGDSKKVRELCRSIEARAAQPRTRPLFQLICLDEVDSVGRRAAGDEGGMVTSSAHNEAVNALLAEMDGMAQPVDRPGQPPSHVLWIGLSNLPAGIDPALSRPDRLGDLVLEVPTATREVAEGILAVYARSDTLPWYVDGEVRTGLTDEEIREYFLRPALDQIYDQPVLRCATDGPELRPVTAGELLASVHYKATINLAKKRAARRSLQQLGVPAVTPEDVTGCLVEQAASAARQADGDRRRLTVQLRLGGPVTRVELVPEDELSNHRFAQGA